MPEFSMRTRSIFHQTKFLVRSGKNRAELQAEIWLLLDKAVVVHLA